ncbi:hypothetical protein COU61_00275 [Candidatus Pacearchaeota archaeon CG10_big_fil_rev_8_21_14_0_10_35_13]|nr:MAG: hypothetical protein COU61_00275 [Candidatus Pacearchaeota archaeon CG10_big_fil_rev_8_21_14_0_10_35_13]
MKYKRLHNVAKKIDELRLKKNINRNRILKLLEKFNPEFIGSGAFKRCFKVKANKRYLVLKVGRRGFERDYDHFLLAKGKHKLRYAKIYWVTDNCLLQKFASSSEGYTREEYEELKREWKKAGYVDVRSGNIGKINGMLHAFDVSESRRNCK